MGGTPPGGVTISPGARNRMHAPRHMLQFSPMREAPLQCEAVSEVRSGREVHSGEAPVVAAESPGVGSEEDEGSSLNMLYGGHVLATDATLKDDRACLFSG